MPHVHSPFHLLDDPKRTPLVLTEAKGHASAPNLESFSLFFRGPREPRLQQQIHRLYHEQLGELAIFLVPIGMDASGIQYEAVFNLLRKSSGS